MLISLPALPVLFHDVKWRPMIPQQQNTSEYTGRSQVIGQPGTESWAARALCVAIASDAEERAWHAFLSSLRGAENTFYLPARTKLQTTAAQPTVTAAVAGNRAVTVSSTANVAVGMWATVQQANGHRRLVKVTAIAGSNVGFEPGLTGAPATGVPLVIGDPFGLVRLVQPLAELPTFGESFELQVREAL